MQTSFSLVSKEWWVGYAEINLYVYVIATIFVCVSFDVNAIKINFIGVESLKRIRGNIFEILN